MKRYLCIMSAALLAAGIAAAQPKIGPCAIFPANNPWNIDISDTIKYPTSKLSGAYIAHINQSRQYLHPDFGSDTAWGIPYTVVGSAQPPVQMTYTMYGDESDPGPFPIPPDAMVEGGRDPSNTGDRHVLIVDTGDCMLYEFWQAAKDANDDNWTSSNGAAFDLAANHYRPDTWTSADAAGLPIFPGLVRYDEAQSGEIRHAVRFTVPVTSRAWIFPARHQAGSTNDTTYPPMGLRLRLKAGYDLSPYTGQVLAILNALKRYGMILADNGSAWFISGATDTRWNDDTLAALKGVPGSAFEAVDMGYRLETGNDTISLPGDSLPAQTAVNERVLREPNATLLQNAPNPFADLTLFYFTLPTAERTRLEIYDALGRRVAALIDGIASAGAHTARFDASALPAGVYIARLRAGGNVAERAAIVAK